jgi:HAD superfamily hydrolase (TIGR01490 family)
VEKRVVAVFDFDGTITRGDTFLPFILFSRGRISLCLGILRYSLLLLAYKMQLYPNWKIKQKLFSYFFKDMHLSEFSALGERFADVVNRMTHPEAVVSIHNYLQQNATTYVISASVEEWVKPWCQSMGIRNIIATRVETDARGFLTGHFSTNNCYGQEKVTRLLEKEPDRETYILFAYGDSRGDKELMAFADKSWYKHF